MRGDFYHVYLKEIVLLLVCKISTYESSKTITQTFKFY